MKTVYNAGHFLKTTEELRIKRANFWYNAIDYLATGHEELQRFSSRRRNSIDL